VKDGGVWLVLHDFSEKPVHKPVILIR